MNSITIRSNNLQKLYKYQNYFNRKGLQSFLVFTEEICSLRIVGLTLSLFNQFATHFHLTNNLSSYALAA